MSDNEQRYLLYIDADGCDDDPKFDYVVKANGCHDEYPIYHIYHKGFKSRIYDFIFYKWHVNKYSKPRLVGTLERTIHDTYILDISISHSGYHYHERIEIPEAHITIKSIDN